jgi:hypothetical protein
MTQRKPIHRIFIERGVIMLGVFLWSCQAVPTVQMTEPAKTAAELTVVPVPANTPSIPPGWKEYVDDSLGIRLRYPQEWKGPEVYAAENRIILEIGSAAAFPYGTNPEDRIYPEVNQYFVDVLFFRNSSHLSMEQLQDGDPASNWSYGGSDYDIYLALMNLADGESMVLHKEAVAKSRNVTLDGFRGVEYVAASTEDAQSMILYERQTTLIDADNDMLEIIGIPIPVYVPNVHWRDTNRAVDEAFLELYRIIIESISVS